MSSIQETLNVKDGLLDRVGRVEQALDGIVKTIQAISRVVGAAEVQAEQAAGLRADMTAQVAKAVEDGRLQKVDVVGAESLIVGHEALANGQFVYPGRLQVFANELTEENRPLFVGQKTGSKVTVQSGNVVTIVEVYDVPGVQTAPAPAKKTRKTRAPKT